MNTAMMNTAYTNSLSSLLAEDVHAPELRNPRYSGMRAKGWMARLLRKSRKAQG